MYKIKSVLFRFLWKYSIYMFCAFSYICYKIFSLLHTHTCLGRLWCSKEMVLTCMGIFVTTQLEQIIMAFLFEHYILDTCCLMETGLVHSKFLGVQRQVRHLIKLNFRYSRVSPGVNFSAILNELFWSVIQCMTKWWNLEELYLNN